MLGCVRTAGMLQGFPFLPWIAMALRKAIYLLYQSGIMTWESDVLTPFFQTLSENSQLHLH